MRGVPLAGVVGGRRRLRLVLHLLSATGLVVFFVAAWAAPARAHASLTGTEPAASTAVPDPPAQVRLRFTEGVEVAFGAVQVVDGAGARIQTGRAFHPDGQESVVAVDLPPLGPAGYLVTWRVISGDSHPVQGAFTFRVGSGGPADTEFGSAATLFGSGSGTVKTAFTVSRLVGFAALVLVVGGTAFVVLSWPTGARDRRVARLLGAGWVLAVASTVAGIGLQGAYAGALPLAAALRPSVFSAVLVSRFGQLSLIRLVLLLLVVPLWWALRRSIAAGGGPTAPGLAVPAALLGGAILLTLGLSGHAGVGDLVALSALADVLHLAGVSVWLGGLAVLALCALPRREAHELAVVVPRFSTLAFTSVVVIVATGSFQTWRQVGSVEALTATGYGQTLLVKLGLFVGLVGLGAASRAWVRRRFRAPVLVAGPGAALAEAPALRVARLRRSVAAEVVIAVAVLSVSAALANTTPARASLATPHTTDLVAKGLHISLDVDPAGAGPTDITVLTADHAGQVVEVQSVDALLRLDAQAIGPLKVSMHRTGPGRFVAHRFQLPLAGTWKIELVIMRDRLDQVRAVTTFPVR